MIFRKRSISKFFCAPFRQGARLNSTSVSNTAAASSTGPFTPSSTDSSTSLPKMVEENRILPVKYNGPAVEAVIRQSRKEVLAQMSAGGIPRMPYRLWRLIFSKSNDYTFEQYVALSKEERIVHGEHWRAMQERKLTYKDPYLKKEIMTAAALLLQGRCCGVGCRHCPYDLEHVPNDVAVRRKWNGAFYV